MNIPHPGFPVEISVHGRRWRMGCWVTGSGDGISPAGGVHDVLAVNSPSYIGVWEIPGLPTSQALGAGLPFFPTFSPPTVPITRFTGCRD